MSTNGETTPLLNSGSGDNNYYFLNAEGKAPGVVGDQEVEELPPGATEEDFQPRVLGARGKEQSMLSVKNKNQGFLSSLLGFGSADPVHAPSPLKPRKAPIKIEPKVFFSNERTFLAWMHVSIILAGASIAILAFAGKKSNPGSEIYGLVMLPVAVGFIVYSMYQYTRRAFMIRNKLPGPYEDVVGPTLLGITLMISITCQFAIKLYSIAT